MIVYTRHTEQRLIERRINRAWIDATIMSPDWTTSDPDPTLTRSYKAIKAASGRVLRVVHRPDGPDTLVITALFDRGAHR